MSRFLQKLVLAGLVVAGYAIWSGQHFQQDQVVKTEQAMRQLDDAEGTAVQQAQLRQHSLDNNLYLLGWVGVAVVCVTFFAEDVVRLFRRSAMTVAAVVVCVLVASNSGCGRRPFEPVKLEVIKSN